jgi:predicted rRNA methylase YqxC with S4 and FtsJ domains
MCGFLFCPITFLSSFLGSYMKYACAAYGESMIRAAQIDVQGKIDDRVGLSDVARIANHIGIPESDMVRVDVSFRGDSKYLRHFVAVDHVNRQVVLAIRGTFNLSEIIVDIGGFTSTFVNRV